jgi:lipoprotein NlpI
MAQAVVGRTARRRGARVTRLRRLAGAGAFVLAAGCTGAHAAEKEPQCGGASADSAAAVQACTRLIEFGSLERPDLAKAYYARGSEWANQGNADRAIPDFNLAIELDPKLAPAYYNRALAWSSKGDTERAIADYGAAMKLTPTDPNPWLGRAAEWIAKADYKRAVADYEGALRLASRSSQAYFGRGRARFYAGEFTLAASDFYRAHQLEPGIYSALWLFLARKRAGIAGEKTLAHEAGTSGAGAWPAPVVALYLGAAPPDAVARAAGHPDPTRQRDLRCEASFYIAQWHVLRGARDAAGQLFREAESTCPRTFIEREGAAAELKRPQMNR